MSSSITRIPVPGCPGLYQRQTADGLVYEGRIKHRGSSLRRTLKAKNLRAAKKELAAWRVDLGRAVPEAQSRQAGTTFSAVYELYLERLRVEGRAENTVTNAGYRFRHLAPLHTRNVASISRGEVVVIMRRLLKSQRPSSVRSVAVLGSAVFGEAIERGLATHNPFHRLRLPAAATGPKRNLAPADVHALVAATSDLMKPLVAVLAFSGCRVSEACGLTWGCLDLDAGRIRISGQLQGGKRERTKTEAGQRGVGIPEQLVTLLREHRKAQVERGLSVAESAWVFASITGTPMDRRRAHRVVQASARKAGLIGPGENLRVHDLRAAFALSSLRAGRTLPELQRALGHRKPDQSLQYAAVVAKDAIMSSPYGDDHLAQVVELRAVGE